jgi:hypothetical protein
VLVTEGPDDTQPHKGFVARALEVGSRITDAAFRTAGALTIIYVAAVLYLLVMVAVATAVQYEAGLVTVMVVVAVGALLGGYNTRPLAITAFAFAASPWMRELQPNLPSPWASVPVTFFYLTALTTPFAVALDRASRRRLRSAADTARRFQALWQRTPYAEAVAQGFFTATTAAATVYFSRAIGDPDIAAIEIGLLVGIGVTTLSSIRADRKRTSPPVEAPAANACA